jgi:hypothetical protein
LAQKLIDIGKLDQAQSLRRLNYATSAHWFMTGQLKRSIRGRHRPPSIGRFRAAAMPTLRRSRASMAIAVWHLRSMQRSFYRLVWRGRQDASEA